MMRPFANIALKCFLHPFTEGQPAVHSATAVLTTAQPHHRIIHNLSGDNAVNIPPTNSFDDGNSSGMPLPGQSAANAQSTKGDEAIMSISLSIRILHCNPQASY
eukprot:CAMPEP_0201900314 /NCGR_PEP_ID=MMETSP0902-20130614/52068_1 /ASSEMBLY_ACC=CAM_ASM_000551 /TAXON_ID=420261 /ORGANISM="Thalassiosira antarctica, Strain CCMP982" /LENGTH=103 /DNA_ID=CAMNT_0048433939 /DNA_START=1 /DNA_END=310 /DNA_ORIENTATION=+